MEGPATAPPAYGALAHLAEGFPAALRTVQDHPNHCPNRRAAQKLANVYCFRHAPGFFGTPAPALKSLRETPGMFFHRGVAAGLLLAALCLARCESGELSRRFRGCGAGLALLRGPAARPPSAASQAPGARALITHLPRARSGGGATRTPVPEAWWHHARSLKKKGAHTPAAGWQLAVAGWGCWVGDRDRRDSCGG